MLEIRDFIRGFRRQFGQRHGAAVVLIDPAPERRGVALVLQLIQGGEELLPTNTAALVAVEDQHPPADEIAELPDQELAEPVDLPRTGRHAIDSSLPSYPLLFRAVLLQFADGSF